MFKTLTKIALFVLLIGLLLVTGCSGDNFSVSGGPSASDEVFSNGGTVIQKGNYIYFINGTSSQNAENTFGTPVKGSIVRMNLSTKEKVIVVPKVVMSSYAKGGFYIFGNKIYYTSPSMEKDKNGNRLSSYLDYFSANLNGSDTKKILTTTSSSYPYKFFEKDNVVYLLYIDTSAAKVFIVNTVNNAKAVLIEDYTNTPVFAEDGYVYYTKAVYKDEQKKDEIFTYNKLYRISNWGGTPQEIKCSDNRTITQEKFSVTLSEIMVFGEDTVLYFTKKSATDIADPIIIPEGLYSFKIGDSSDKMLLASSSSAFDLTNRVYLEENKFLGVYTVSSGDGQTQTGTLYYVDCTDVEDTVLKPIMQNPAKIIKVENDYIYYLKNVDSKNLLYKIFIGEDFEYNPQGEEVLKDVSFSTSDPAPEVIGDYIYFRRSDGDYPDYVYRYKYTDNEAEAELISEIAEEDIKEDEES